MGKGQEYEGEYMTKPLHKKKISELGVTIGLSALSKWPLLKDYHVIGYSTLKQWGIAVIKDKMKYLPKDWLKDKEGKEWGFRTSEADMTLVHFLIYNLDITEEDLK